MTSVSTLLEAPPPPSLLKRLEIFLKLRLLGFASVLLWRPFRARERQSRLAQVGKVLVVRTDNRVGEALLTTPVFGALKSLKPPPEVHVLTHAKAVRVLEAHPHTDRVFALRGKVGGSSWIASIRDIRRENYDVVVNAANWAAPSVGAVLVARLCGPRSALIGPALPPLMRLQTVSVLPDSSTRSETVQRLHLVSPLGVDLKQRLSFRERPASERVHGFLESVRGKAVVTLYPGGRLDWRRIPPEVFGAVARALAEAGAVPIVAWGPGEAPLCKAVTDACPQALVAPATDLDELAVLFRASKMSVCNNTGPMHLSVAVRTPTVGLFFRMDVERWGHATPPHAMIDLSESGDAMHQRAVGAALRQWRSLPDAL
ncbi:MAG: glycosyltransferase family 9 protein [Myxococcaceae bacterium]